MDLGLQDKVCLVTGSTGGIGLETARVLAAEGAKVAVTGRRPEGVEAARRDAGAAVGVVGDLADAEGPAAVVDDVTAQLGPIECLVYNVGDAYQATIEELSDRQWEDIWQLNVMAYVRAIRAVLPAMKERESGVIVNVASTSGQRPSTS